MADYSKMTDSDFDRYLTEAVRSLSAEQWLAIPGIYDVMREAYNNEVLDAWSNDNPELAYPEDEEAEES